MKANLLPRSTFVNILGEKKPIYCGCNFKKFDPKAEYFNELNPVAGKTSALEWISTFSPYAPPERLERTACERDSYLGETSCKCPNCGYNYATERIILLTEEVVDDNPRS